MTLDRRAFIAGAASAVVLGACTAARRATVTRRPAPSTTTTTAATAAASVAEYVPDGPRDVPLAALTFHASGDPALADQLLGAAARLHVPITVFAVGRWLESTPGMARRILDAGHELANHTYTHPTLGRLPRPDVAAEISRCRDVLVRETGNDGRWFRPSGVEGAPSRLILEEAASAGYRTVVGFDVDPHDYADPGADAVVRAVAIGIRAGSIVSLHFGHAGTLAAFDRVVAGARARGLELVTVGRLLA